MEKYRNLLTDTIRSAFEEISQLTYEMEEAYDNTPEPLKKSDVGDRRGAAAFALDRLNEPLVPVSLRGDEHLIERKEISGSKLFRPARRDNVASSLQACVDYLARLRNDDAEHLKKEIQEIIRQLKDVDFPGMFPRSGSGR
jgi:hypothetical protein